MFDFLSLTAIRAWWDRLRCAAEYHQWIKTGNRTRHCTRCSRRQWLNFQDGWKDA